MRSWDIFDTLVARRCVEPTCIFDRVEQKTGFPRFKFWRVEAEKQSNGTWNGIYQVFAKLTGCSSSQIKELQQWELQLEKENLFLIPEIYHQIQPGDILVSDMYLSSEQIWDLLQSIGFHKDVQLFVSYAGKYTGFIWSEIKSQGYWIDLHTGDNSWSDVSHPRYYGIQTRLWDKTKLTPDEKHLRSLGWENLTQMIREIRLSNPYPPNSWNYKAWNEQCQINLPLLYLASILIHDRVKEKKISTILFPTRDGAHWHRIYSKMFPQDRVIYFHASRHMFNTPNSNYTQYIRSLDLDLPHTLYVDVHGTGKSPTTFFQREFGVTPHIFILTVPYKSSDKVEFLRKTSNDSLEMLNYDQVGTLLDYTSNGPVRGSLEYHREDIRPYHECVDLFLQKLAPYLEFHSIQDIRRACLHCISASTRSLVIHQKVTHCKDHIPKYIPIHSELNWCAWKIASQYNQVCN